MVTNISIQYYGSFCFRNSQELPIGSSDKLPNYMRPSSQFQKFTFTQSPSILNSNISKPLNNYFSPKSLIFDAYTPKRILKIHEEVSEKIREKDRLELENLEQCGVLFKSELLRNRTFATFTSSIPYKENYTYSYETLNANNRKLSLVVFEPSILALKGAEEARELNKFNKTIIDINTMSKSSVDLGSNKYSTLFHNQLNEQISRFDNLGIKQVFKNCIEHARDPGILIEILKSTNIKLLVFVLYESSLYCCSVGNSQLILSYEFGKYFTFKGKSKRKLTNNFLISTENSAKAQVMSINASNDLDMIIVITGSLTGVKENSKSRLNVRHIIKEILNILLGEYSHNTNETGQLNLSHLNWVINLKMHELLSGEHIPTNKKGQLNEIATVFLTEKIINLNEQEQVQLRQNLLNTNTLMDQAKATKNILNSTKWSIHERKVTKKNANGGKLGCLKKLLIKLCKHSVKGSNIVNDATPTQSNLTTLSLNQN